MKKVSIDFDNTLTKLSVQNYVKQLLLMDDIEVNILTAREDDALNTSEIHMIDNRDLWDVINDLGIKKDKVRFTGYEDKYHFLKDDNYILHLDDDGGELNNIYKFTNVHPINVTKDSWINKCNDILGVNIILN